MQDSIAWSLQFLVLATWTGVCVGSGLTESVHGRRGLRIGADFVKIVIFPLYKLLLALTWDFTIGLMTAYFVLMYLPSALNRGWHLRDSARFPVFFAASSWAGGCVLYVAVGLHIRSPIWIAGSAILGIGALVAAYYGLAVRPIVALLNPSMSAKQMHSGFVLPDEVPSMMALLISALILFPLLNLMEDAVGRMLLSVFQAPTTSVLAFLVALCAVVSLAITLRWPSATLHMRAILAKAIVGMWGLLCMSILALVTRPAGDSTASLLRAAALIERHVDTSALVFLSDVGVYVWTAAILTLLLQMVASSLTITYIVLGGHRK